MMRIKWTATDEESVLATKRYTAMFTDGNENVRTMSGASQLLSLIRSLENFRDESLLSGSIVTGTQMHQRNGLRWSIWN